MGAAACAVLIAAAVAQQPPPVTSSSSSTPMEASQAAPEPPAQLQGIVINDATEAPLRRARVILTPLEAGLSATGADADDEGHFLLRDIPKGLYTLSASRDGFLTNTQPLTGTLRMPPSFRLEPGQKINDLTFRLRPWAILSGRVRYSDGDYAVNIRVELYRTDHIRGRSAYSLAATAATNDRGEYRVYGLAPGAYIVAAVYDAPAASNFREQPVRDSDGRELPAVGYMTTFYPNTELMSQAVPVRLAYGQELGGIDLALRLARKLTIRGRVLDATTGVALSSGSVALARADQSGQGMMQTNSRATFDREGRFQIPSVSPGSYAVLVRAAGENGTVLTGHALLVVGSDDIDDFDVIAAPAESWPGRIVTEGPGVLPANSAPRITLEPRSINAQVCSTSASADKESGELAFNCNIQRDEIYDVFADSLPDDFYLSQVRVGGTDVKAVGLPGSVISKTPFEVLLDSRGGRVSGVIAGSEGLVWSGAAVALIPDPPARRWQDYRFVSADANGRFLFRGVAPGTYTLLGWLDQTPCDVYDPEGLDRCRATGTSLTVSAGTEQTLILTMRSLPEQ